MKNIDRVREFHETYNCFINTEETMENVPMELMMQRYNLIAEEINELLNAVMMDDQLEMLDALTDIEYVIDGTLLTFGIGYPTLDTAAYEGMRNQINEGLFTFSDMFSDPKYSLSMLLQNILFGVLSAYTQKNMGDMKTFLTLMRIWLDVAFKAFNLDNVREAAGVEVHRSNMSKLGEDGKPIYRETDGKVLKGSNYFEPNLRQFISGQGTENARAG